MLHTHIPHLNFILLQLLNFLNYVGSNIWLFRFFSPRRRSILRKLSKQSTVIHSSRSFSSGLHHSVSSSESLPGSPTHSLSPGPSTPCRSPAPDHQAIGESLTSKSVLTGKVRWYTHYTVVILCYSIDIGVEKYIYIFTHATCDVQY